MAKKKIIFHIVLLFLMALTSFYGCSWNKGRVNGRAFVDFKWKADHIGHTSTGWTIYYGNVVNKGTKRADWVKITIKYRHKHTGIIVGEKSVYIQGSGPNGKSLEPGESGYFELRLDTKKRYPYKYEREVTWSEAY